MQCDDTKGAQGLVAAAKGRDRSGTRSTCSRGSRGSGNMGGNMTCIYLEYFPATQLVHVEATLAATTLMGQLQGQRAHDNEREKERRREGEKERQREGEKERRREGEKQRRREAEKERRREGEKQRRREGEKERR